MTKEAAIDEFSKRGNTLTFDKGNGYVFAYTMDGVAVLAPVPTRSAQPHGCGDRWPEAGA